MFQHDYTQCMMTKLKMADPDTKGGSIIYCDCDKALEIIKQTDNLTLGIKKIIYLVGWQYLGHDDKYPAFFEANKGIKRACDPDAMESLRYLMVEARRYNTVVSLHINFTDAYEDSPLFEDYARAGALIRNAKGKPAKIEKYNNKPCYKVSYKEEWESGLFQARVDRLLQLLPIQEAGTIHVDNFQCYINRKPYISATQMQYYRKKMIDYLSQKGVDITTEFPYREGRASAISYGKFAREVMPTRYPFDLAGLVPAVWQVIQMSLDEFFAYYPHVLGGGEPKNKIARNLFYGNMHAESLWLKDEWHSQFIKEFCTFNLPFFYLNKKQRIGFTDKSQKEVVYSDSTLTKADGTIISDGEIIKKDGNVFIPYMDGYVAYSERGERLSGRVSSQRVAISQITAEGLEQTYSKGVQNGRISLDTVAGKAYYIRSVN